MVVPIRNLNDRPASVIFDRLERDRLRRQTGHEPLLADAVRDRLEQVLADPRRAPQITAPYVEATEVDSPTLELPEVTPFRLAHWLDPAVAPVPLAVGTEPPAAALELVAQLHACLNREHDNHAGEAVARALGAGLEQRLGRQLSDGDRAVYLTLRSLVPEGAAASLRACVDCWIVFAAPRARFCPACLRNPPRSSAGEAADVVVGDRRHGATCLTIVGATIAMHGWRPRAGTPTRTAYQRSCADCGATFIAGDARARYCPTHATSGNRSRRARARRCLRKFRKRRGLAAPRRVLS